MSEMAEEVQGLSHAAVVKAFSEQSLFENKTWRYSPVAFPLDAKQVAEIELIGQACYDFYRAHESLYLRSATGKNLLRNRELKAPWVAEYLDRGKPEALIEHARSKALRGSTPMVVRPDLLMTENGFALTEIDSVPGGIGLTAFLNRLYEGVHADALIGAGTQDMVEAFYQALCSRAPDVISPMIAILVSDEAATYRPEMEWVAEELRLLGRRVYVYHTDDVMPLGDTICVPMDGEPLQVDVIYRFWELFDLANVSIAEHLLKARRESQLSLTPPMRPFQEEKLNLALFHHHMLEDFWKEALPKASYRVLKRVIPQSWIMDPVELPPNAVLDAPLIGGKPMTNWLQLADASKKERNLIIKISGFHESAWGARSVTLGSDSSKADWESAIQQAVTMADTSLHILQTYEKPRRLRHPVYSEDGSLYQMEGRMRLCPYYFVDEKAQRAHLHGVLATLCPADKKIIHGMKDAALLPCVLAD
ncbi:MULTISPECIES: hypothetical protein [unclassified Lentimonas]|uniref:hypothetical protein n=2 Tax=Lentimonas TaxID=417293 RepID=UPI0013239156|nr:MULTISPECIES: hypothetical protein [unclassified Lentimonas]CAA6695203.1 Unannotated [Lentimonas sp. CC19]CAA6697292.1 Unannotated [Lentimonas sp. CC10]CAA7070425.1 Unannotated [Lentimonas sp. CC11]